MMAGAIVIAGPGESQCVSCWGRLCVTAGVGGLDLGLTEVVGWLWCLDLVPIHIIKVMGT